MIIYKLTSRITFVNTGKQKGCKITKQHEWRIGVIPLRAAFHSMLNCSHSTLCFEKIEVVIMPASHPQCSPAFPIGGPEQYSINTNTVTVENLNSYCASLSAATRIIVSVAEISGSICARFNDTRIKSNIRARRIYECIPILRKCALRIPPSLFSVGTKINSYFIPAALIIKSNKRLSPLEAVAGIKLIASASASPVRISGSSGVIAETDCNTECGTPGDFCWFYDSCSCFLYQCISLLLISSLKHMNGRIYWFSFNSLKLPQTFHNPVLQR